MFSATQKPTILEYVWTDLNENLRSKIKVLLSPVHDIEDCPTWNFDGSSTGQAVSTEVSDVILNPVRLYKNPLIDHSNAFIVLCECLNRDLTVHSTNHRSKCVELSKKVEQFECLFGIEQEYILMDRDRDIRNLPYKWLNVERPGVGVQGPYYCGVGGDRSFGREISNEHLLACLKAGVHICGTNSEVMPSQWEFQIGTCDMVTVSDDLYVARFILHKITEKYNCYATFHPKPLQQWNGSGGHTNFSTNLMRTPNSGIFYIREACEQMSEKHVEHISVYGLDNDLRLSGKFETSSIDTFSWGEMNRAASIRIPLQVCVDNCGYLEDRRPAANLNPYLVTERIVRTACCCNEKSLDETHHLPNPPHKDIEYIHYKRY